MRHSRFTRSLTVAAAGGILALVGSSAALAHTESDLVAVPAGARATVTLKPTHGCDGSPTTEVRIRAPFPDAVAEAVDGWTSTSEPDGNGNTVLSWTGGSLAADEHGAFPVEFVAAAEPGTLLLFPAVQHCENGEELAWIDGDPEGDYPAPRLLVLPADFEEAASIEDIPAGAPGIEQLTQIVDVDNPSGATPESTTSAPPSTGESVPVTEPPVTTAAPIATPPVDKSTAATDSVPIVISPAPDTTAVAESDGGGNSTGTVIAAVVGAVVLVGAVVAVVVRARRKTS